MRTGVALQQIRKEVLIEAGLSTKAGHNLQQKERVDALINRTERLMAKLNDWDAVDHYQDVAITADTALFDVPTEIDTTMVDAVWALQGDEWWPVEYDISQRDRSVISAAERSEPVLKWRLVPPGNAQFEIWPISPVATTLRFEGQKKLGGMVNEGDLCVLDADVIVLRAAGKMLARDNKEDAALALRDAENLTNIILKRQGGAKREPSSMGTRRGKPRPRAGIDYIPPGSA